MDLATDGVVISDALKYVNYKQEQTDTIQMLDKRINATKEERREKRRRSNYQ